MEQMGNMKMKRTKFTTAIDPVLRDELKIQAVREGKSASDILESLIKEYLAKVSGVPANQS